MTVPIIEVKNVTIHYDEGILLEDLNFEVYEGEIFAILGGSGSGKSMLLKHIIGLFDPASGEIRLQGTTISAASDELKQDITSKIGILYQSAALLGSMNVLANVGLPLKEHTDLTEGLISALACQKLAAVGLEGFEAYLPANLSGGMQKRAGIARALIVEPDLLFLDEPTSGLDPITSAELDQLILQIREKFGTTLLIVSHDLDSVFTVADRVLLLKDKRIAAIGNPKEIARKHADEWVRAFFSRANTKDFLSPKETNTPN